MSPSLKTCSHHDQQMNKIKGQNPNARLMHGLTFKPVAFTAEKYLVIFDVKIEILSGLFFLYVTLRM